MTRRSGGRFSAGAAAALAVGAAGAAAAQEAAPSALGAIGPWLGSVQVDGRIEAGATMNPQNPVSGINFGRLYTDKANQLVLNQFDLRAWRDPDLAAGRPDLGFAVEGSYGMDSQFNHFLGIGDQGSTGRNSFDLVQANLDLGIPFRRGVATVVTGGLFVTPMGYESLDPRDNFFYSHSYVFDFGLPRKHAGVVTTTHVGSALDVVLGYTTGANTSFGPGGGYDDGEPHLLGGIAWRDRDITVRAFTHIGPEDTPVALPPGADPHRELRYYEDLSVAWAVSRRLNVATELNYVRDDGLRAEAGGIAQYLTYRFSPVVSAGARAEVWRDAQGAFVAGYPGNLDYVDAEQGLPNGAFRPGAATYGELTVGLNIRPMLDLRLGDRPIDSPFGQVIIRPEIRYDRVLAGASGFGSRPGSARDQTTFGVDVVVPLSFQHNAPEDGERAQPVGASVPPDGPPAGDAPLASAAGETFATAGRDARRNTPQMAAAVLAHTDPQVVQDLDGYLTDVALNATPTGGLAPSVRGLGGGAPHTGQAPAVGLNLDGVTIDGAFAQLLDPAEFAGVDVAYGPSGLFEGRDAAAGVIDFRRRAPTRAWGLDAQYSLEQGYHANNERVRLDAPVGPTAGLEISFSHRQRGGYLDNIYTGDGLYGRDEVTSGNLQFDWSVTPALDADLSITLAHGDGQGNPFALGDRLDAQILGPTLAAIHPGLQFNSYGSPYLPDGTQPLGAFQTAADGPNGQSLTAQLYALTLAYDSPVGRLTSITAFLDEGQATGQDLDGGCAVSDLAALPCPTLANPLVGVLHLSTSLTYRQFSQELRLDHDFAAVAQGRIGAYVIDDRTTRTQATRGVDNFAADAPAEGPSSAQTGTGYALFAEVNVHPTSRLSLSGGFRWSWDSESYSVADEPPADAGPALAGRTSRGELLSRVALDYQLTDGISLYAQRATGFRPGGLALASTLSERFPGQPNYDPANPDASYATFGSESDTSYEAGSRVSLLDGRLTGRLAGYFTRVKNLQVPQLVLTPAFGQVFNTYIVNLPRVETDGAELELAWRPAAAPGLTLSGQGAYENARITDGLIPAAQAPATPFATAGAVGTTFNLTGAPLVRAPRFTGTVRADYALVLGPGRFAFGADYRWTDRYALAVSDGLGDDQPAFGLMDISASYERSFYRISISARNILDHVYFADAVPAFFAHTWAEPRTVVVSLGVKF
jgi:outer membrane receptor protein involved in Fe transport